MKSSNLAVLLASVLYIGYAPIAPGTFGSFAAAVAVWIFQPGLMALAVSAVLVFFIGLWASGETARAVGREDPGLVVIDEVAGYLVSVMFLPLTPGYIIAAFFLFRFFDILKPPPVRNAERRFSGGLGIMLDDVLAGVYTNLGLQAWKILISQL